MSQYKIFRFVLNYYNSIYIESTSSRNSNEKLKSVGVNSHPKHQNRKFCYLKKIENLYILILTSVRCWTYDTDQKCQKNQHSKINRFRENGTRKS